MHVEIVRGCGQLSERANDSGEIVHRLQFRVLGPVQVLDHDGTTIDVGGSKPRLVLVQLLLSPNRMVSTDALVDAVWGEDPPPTARRSLQSHVAKLRAALGGDDGPVQSQSPGYVLRVGEDQIDCWRSEQLGRQARAVLDSNPRQARDLARQARQEWTGQPLADLVAYDQLVAQRRRLDRLGLDLVELELDAELAAGDLVEVVYHLESLVLDRPEHEPFWARLMTAYYRLGRQSDALEAFQRARSALVEALGIDPSPELQRLEVAILGQAVELNDFDAPSCPYKGLASYQLDDADLFYGRDDLIAELLEAVRTSSFVVVVGDSGTGKSSALRAGLVKELGARKLNGIRDACVITPGTAPLRSIYQAPTSADVLVVDQFEELFTLTDDDATQREFVRLLLARVNDGGVRVVISLRADFYGYCTRIPQLAPLLARRQVVVGPLTEHELRVVITRPAEKTGIVVARDLVDCIVAEAADHAGALPLVSHALVETWHRRTDGQLTLEAYRDAVSIAAAIARTAERTYGSFPPAQRAQAERLLLRLVEPSEGTDHARRKVPYAQLEGSSIDRHVIDLLVEARLLTAGSEGIEIAHEALIAAWPRLRSWIDDDRDGIRIHRHLTSAASAWDEIGRDEGELYRGARLSAALSWVGDATPDLSDLERDFIDASAAMSETQLRQQMRAIRRRRVLVAGSVAGVIATIAGTVLAISKADDSDRRRAEAAAANLVVAVRDNPDLSTSAELQLAVAADHRASTLPTQGLLLDAINRDPGFTPRGDLGGVLLTGNSPTSSNGGVLLGIDNNSMLGVVLDTKTKTLKPRPNQGLRLLPGPPQTLVAVVDTGQRLLGVAGRTLQTVDLETGRTVGPSPSAEAGPTEVGLSPDGSTLAVANQAGTPTGVSLYDVATSGRRVTLNSSSADTLSEVTFSPDGRHVLAVVGDSRAVVWDTTSGEETVFTPPSADQEPITRLAMSPSSKLIALGRRDGKVEMWKSDERGRWTELQISTSHSGEISWIDFDSQGARMVSTSSDGVAAVWDTATGNPAARPRHFPGSLSSATYFRADSSTNLVTIDANGRILEWDTQQDGPLFKTVAGVTIGAPVSASPGNRVLVLSHTGVTAFNPADAVQQDLPQFAGSAVSGIAASADGTRFVVVYDDGHLELRDAASGDLVIAFHRPVHIAAYYGSFAVPREPMITLDRGGTHVAYQDGDDQIDVVDDKGKTVDTINLPLTRRDVQALDLNDDGSELVVSTNFGEAIWYDEDGIDAWQIAQSGKGFDAKFVSDDRVETIGGGEVQIIDPRTRQTIKRLAVAKDVKRLAVDRTGRLFATADTTGSIQLWDFASGTSIGAALQMRNISSAPPIRFSADGHYLLVSGPDQTTWIDVRTSDWPHIACSLVTEQLSASERALASLGKSGPCP
jgi:DNA-binding SARP family transcriptional activator/WD40 repeat protein